MTQKEERAYLIKLQNKLDNIVDDLVNQNFMTNEIADAHIFEVAGKLNLAIDDISEALDVL